ncbi:hypothetical protein GQ44DRAFT_760419 [Phaeosphaeriaceae sp. PMI808]|nr:hypothetical protein GQ44DRAFT_760419 [Phaeosphaeriaceae sp. PMI808]
MELIPRTSSAKLDMEMRILELPFSRMDFLKACEQVKDLPFGDCDDDYRPLLSMRYQLRAAQIDPNVFYDWNSVEVPTELATSPIFELLHIPTGEEPKPRTKFRTSADDYDGFRDDLPSHCSGESFLGVIVGMTGEVRNQWEPREYIIHKAFPKLLDGIKLLTTMEINILDFLSDAFNEVERVTTMADFLKNYPLLEVILLTAEAKHSNVVFDYNNFCALLQRCNSEYKYLHVSPYLPSKYPGLLFNEDQFYDMLCQLQTQMHTHDVENFGRVENFDLTSTVVLTTMFRRLDDWINILLEKDIDIQEFMKNHDLAMGSPGGLVFGYLVESLHPDNEEDVFSLFAANVRTGSNGLAFLREVEDYRAFREGRITRLGATTFADALPRVDISMIAQENMKCPFCWANFDQVVEGLDNTPARLPCNPLHVFGRDCVIRCLLSTGPLCPLCRVNVIEVAAN